MYLTCWLIYVCFPDFCYCNVAVNILAHDFGIILSVYPLGKFLVVDLLSQWEQTFKMLTDIAKLPSRGVESVYILGNSGRECLFPHNLVNTGRYQTFACLPVWHMTGGISLFCDTCPYYEWGKDLSHVYELFLLLVGCSYPLPVWWSVYEYEC